MRSIGHKPSALLDLKAARIKVKQMDLKMGSLGEGKKFTDLFVPAVKICKHCKYIGNC
jgi:hypothetical protein